MSHITHIEPKMQIQDSEGATHQLPVKFLNFDLLKQALGLACEGQGKVGTAIKDYFNHERTVDLSVYTPAVQRGIGFVKKGSEYSMVADTYGVERQANTLINKIAQRYIQLSVTNAVKRQHYMTQTQEKDGSIKILARRY